MAFDPDEFVGTATATETPAFDPNAFTAEPAGGFDPSTFASANDTDIQQATDDRAKELAADTNFDPEGHASQHEPGSPQYELAYKAQQERDNLPFMQRLSSITPSHVGDVIGHTLKTIANLPIGAGTAVYSLGQQGLTGAEAMFGNAVGADDFARNAEQLNQHYKAQGVLGGQMAETSFRGLLDSGAHGLQKLGALIRDKTGTLPDNPGAEARFKEDWSKLVDNAKNLSPDEYVKQAVQLQDDYHKSIYDGFISEGAKVHRNAFDENVANLKQQQQLASGQPLDTGAVAGISRFTDSGVNPSELYSPGALAASGAPPVDESQVKSMGSAADPGLLAFAAAPELPGAATLGGGALELTGKAFKAPADLLGFAGGKMGRVAKAASLGSAATMVAETALHNPALAVKLAAGAAATKGFQAIGEVLEQQGKELRTGTPSKFSERVAKSRATGTHDFAAETKKLVGDTLGMGAAGMLSPTMLGITAATSEGDPSKAVDAELTAGTFGGALSLLHSQRPMLIEAIRPHLRDQGLQSMDTKSEFGQKSKAYLDAMDDPRRNATLEIMGGFQGLKAQNQSGTNSKVQIYPLSEPDFKQAVADHGGPIDAEAQGYFVDSQGKVFVNGDSELTANSALQLGHTVGHESSHAAMNILRAMGDKGAPLLKGIAQTAKAELMPDGKPSAEFKEFVDNYNAAFPEAMKDHRLDINDPKAIEEFLAETGGHIMANGIGDLAIPKGILDKLQGATAKVVGGFFGIPPKTTGLRTGILGNESEAITEELRKSMAQIVGMKLRGDEAPDYPPFTPEATKPPVVPPAGAPEAPAAAFPAPPEPVKPLSGVPTPEAAPVDINEAQRKQNEEGGRLAAPVEAGEFAKPGYTAIQPLANVPADEPTTAPLTNTPVETATGILEPPAAGAALPEEGRQTPNLPTPQEVQEALGVADKASLGQKPEKVSKARQEALRSKLPSFDARSAKVGETAPDELHVHTDEFGKTSVRGTIDPANPLHEAFLKEAGLSEDQRQQLTDLQAKRGQVAYIDYGAAKVESGKEHSAEQRAKELSESDASERAAGGETTEQVNKAVIPLQTKIAANGKVSVVAYSPDKLHANALAVVRAAHEAGFAHGYEGSESEINAAISRDIATGVTNHANGWSMDGQTKLRADAGPAETFKDAQGNPLDPKTAEHRQDVLNMAANDAGATDSAAHAAKVKAYDAKLKAWQEGGEKGRKPSPPKERAERSKVEEQDAHALAVKKDGYLNPETGETNMLRDALSTVGFDASKLEATIENLRPELIRDIRDQPNGDRSIVRAQGEPASRPPNAGYVRGGFMPKGKKDILANSEDTKKKAERFYSQLPRTVADIPRDDMTVERAIGFLRKGTKDQPRVNESEIKLSGILTDPLSPLVGRASGDKITKQELLDYATERQTKLEDVTYDQTQKSRSMRTEDIWKLQNKLRDLHRDLRNERDEAAQTNIRAQIEDINNELTPKDESLRPKFADTPSLNTPGALPNSRKEIFVTWPHQDPNFLNKEEAIKKSEELFNKAKQRPDWPNVNTLYDTSWWQENHPEEAKEYYRLRDIANRRVSGEGNWLDGHQNYADITNPIVRIRSGLHKDADGKLVYMIDEMQGPGKEQQAKMPPELRDNIYQIGFKRALREATDQGADKIAWTTGDTQADRYDLSKRVESIRIENIDGNANQLSIYVKPKDGGYESKIAEGVPLEKLSNHVGKDIAEKFQAGLKDKPETQIFDGLDLKVGGEGLRKLYDKTLPSEAKKFGDKFGVQVGKTDLSLDHNAATNDLQEWNQGKVNDILARGGEVYALDRHGHEQNIDSPEALKEFLEEFLEENKGTPEGFYLGDIGGKQTVHSMDIPEAMHLSQQEKGNPVFMPKAKSEELKADLEKQGIDAKDFYRSNPKKKQIEAKRDAVAQAAFMLAEAKRRGINLDENPDVALDLGAQWRKDNPREESKQHGIPEGYLGQTPLAEEGVSPNDAIRSREALLESAPDATRSARRAAELRPLVEASKKADRVFGPELEKLVGAEGVEHQVVFGPKRVLKITHPGRFGMIYHMGETDVNPKVRWASPAEYLQRIEDWNRELGDDVKVEGVIPFGSDHKIVTSQRTIEGDRPQIQEITKAMTDAGYIDLGESRYYNPETNKLIGDFHTGNVVKNKDGDFVPIDGTIQTPTGALKKWVDTRSQEILANSQDDESSNRFMPKPAAERFGPGFYSLAEKVIDEKFPDRLAQIPARTVEGRVIPGRIIKDKEGNITKEIPDRKEADKQYPAQEVAEQVNTALKAAGVKQEELDWLDLSAHLKDRKEVTKQVLKDIVAANNIEITEHLHDNNEEGGYNVLDYNGDAINSEPFETEREAESFADDYVSGSDHYYQDHKYSVAPKSQGTIYVVETKRDGGWHDIETYEDKQDAEDHLEQLEKENPDGDYNVDERERDEKYFVYHGGERHGSVVGDEDGYDSESEAEDAMNDMVQWDAEEMMKNDRAELSIEPTKGNTKFGPDEGYATENGPDPESYAETIWSAKFKPMKQKVFAIINKAGNVISTDWSSKEGAESYMQNVLAQNQTDFPDPVNNLHVEQITKETPQGFNVSAHWDEKDPVAHGREQIFEDKDGKPIYLSEETQSDLHQQARESRQAQVDAEAEELENKGMPRKEADAEADKKVPKEAGYKTGPNTYKTETRVPDAPLKRTWHEFVFKKQLKRAIEKGAAMFAWLPGQTHNERYGLERFYSKVTYNPESKIFEAFQKGNNSPVVHTNLQSHRQIKDYIGKELAEKLLEQEPKGGNIEDYMHIADEYVSQFQVEEIPSTDKDGETKYYLKDNAGKYYSPNLHEIPPYTVEQDGPGSYGFTSPERAMDAVRAKGLELAKKAMPIATLEGDALRASGQGQEGFYDVKMMNFIKNYIGKWGSSVEKINLENKPPQKGKHISRIEAEKLLANGQSVLAEDRGHEFDINKTEELNRLPDNAFVYERVSTGDPAWAFPITQAMKDSVLGEGQPIWMPKTSAQTQEEKPTSSGARLGSVAPYRKDEEVDSAANPGSSPRLSNVQSSIPESRQLMRLAP